MGNLGRNFINTLRGRSVAWPSIERLGRLDPGSNPGGPIDFTITRKKICQQNDLEQDTEESLKRNTTVVCLIPARTDTKYWHEYCMEYAKEIHFVKGRLKFEGNSNNSAPFPSAVVVFSSGRKYAFGHYPMIYTMEKE